ncbi:MAG: SDR family NAD(P)-dependent oxidoreductase, partial [Myxococcales bacterium]|nr:SDR family NAD(P)-dependent oxidoreductase [Myxococcales bacterium]
MTEDGEGGDIDDDRLRICLEVLAAAAELPAEDPRLLALEQASSRLYKQTKKARKRARARVARERDRLAMAQTGRWRDWDAGRPDVGQLPEANLGQEDEDEDDTGDTLHHQRRCYVCKQPYRRLHHHYHMLCPDCAAENWSARTRRADLEGRRILLTGGRIKIGFELALMLLRDGASVWVTTRFPADAARRFAAVPDHGDFADRLHLIAIDLRYLPDVVALSERLSDALPFLDALINNAAQTVSRPPAWYRELAAFEHGQQPALGEGPAALRPRADALDFLAGFHRSCLADAQTDPEALAAFPPGARDEEGRQLDLRARNSWVLALEHLDARELVEAQLVNATAPALLAARLRPLLDRSSFADRHVVNVSAVEGQFAYANKTPRHPHTNMAKASLNMLTRTCAQDWAEAGIYINSVDTGW